MISAVPSQPVNRLSSVAEPTRRAGSWRHSGGTSICALGKWSAPLRQTPPARKRKVAASVRGKNGCRPSPAGAAPPWRLVIASPTVSPSGASAKRSSAVKANGQPRAASPLASCDSVSRAERAEELRHVPHAGPADAVNGVRLIAEVAGELVRAAVEGEARVGDAVGVRHQRKRGHAAPGALNERRRQRRAQHMISPDRPAADGAARLGGEHERSLARVQCQHDLAFRCRRRKIAGTGGEASWRRLTAS